MNIMAAYFSLLSGPEFPWIGSPETAALIRSTVFEPSLRVKKFRITPPTLSD